MSRRLDAKRRPAWEPTDVQDPPGRRSATKSNTDLSQSSDVANEATRLARTRPTPDGGQPAHSTVWPARLESIDTERRRVASLAAAVDWRFQHRSVIEARRDALGWVLDVIVRELEPNPGGSA